MTNVSCSLRNIIIGNPSLNVEDLLEFDYLRTMPIVPKRQLTYKKCYLPRRLPYTLKISGEAAGSDAGGVSIKQGGRKERLQRLDEETSEGVEGEK